jgi:ankyrin repeat protein
MTWIEANYHKLTQHWSAASGYFEVVKLLVEAGADVNCASDTGMTPLALMGNKWPEISEYLQLHGALVNSPPRERASRKRAPRKPAGSRSRQNPVPPRTRASTVDSTGNVAISPQTSNRGTSQIPSVGTPVANEAFEAIYGENFETAVVFQSPIISNNDQLSASSNWVQLESSYASQMPPPRW